MSAYPSANTSANCKPITKPTHSGPTVQPQKRQRRRRRLRGPRRPIFRRTKKPESDLRLLEEHQNLTESLPIAEHHTERPTDYPVEAVRRASVHVRATEQRATTQEPEAEFRTTGYELITGHRTTVSNGEACEKSQTRVGASIDKSQTTFEALGNGSQTKVKASSD